MATAKLTENDQNSIISRVATICSRVKYVHSFPMPIAVPVEQDLTFKSFLLGETYEHLRALVDSNPETVVMHNIPCVRVATRNGQYEIKFNFNKHEVPFLHSEACVATPKHPHYKALTEWCKEQYLQVRRYDMTSEYVKELVSNSSTAGQVHTGIPFLHTYMKPKIEESLQYAQRRSRLPGDWKVDSGKAKILEHLLMVGALLDDPEWDARYVWPEVKWFES